MPNYRNNDCPTLTDCIKNPNNVSCNIACPSITKNCYESYKVFTPNCFAKVSIPLQPYENLFDINLAFISGTIFKDLYSPYVKVQFVEV